MIFTRRRRVAVIGGGISGLGAAHALMGDHRVTLFEAQGRLGGHARTVLADGVPVDTGFIVYNEATYPELTRLLAELDVPTAPAPMSFSARIDAASGGEGLEYALHSLGTIFAQRRNLVSPGFLGMLRDVMRFNARAEGVARGRPDLTLGELCAEMRLGRRFRDHYLRPFSGAIWSTPPEGMSAFPAEALLRFFRNHGLLGYADGHAWRTVRGGSRAYVDRIEAGLRAAGADIRLNRAPQAVRRGPLGPEVRSSGAWERFDEVVLAVHADMAHALVVDAAPEEGAATGAIAYQPNVAVLHDDPAPMPRRRACWAAWNHVEPPGGAASGVPLTYWMNALQPLPAGRDLFVTLNDGAGAAARIDPARVIDRTVFRHPVYDSRTAGAQAHLARIGGTGGLWYAGAWTGSGFHEDGLRSGLAAARGIARRGVAATAA